LESARTIPILVNERTRLVSSDARLHDVRTAFKPEADVIILNGFPIRDNQTLAAGDEVVLIRRGEIPDDAELEALIVARHGPGVHRKLKDGRVGIAGCGGIGSTVAVALARSGIGSLVLVDFDVVEPSNLNRQHYFIDQIGLPKVTALADNLRRISPFIALKLHERRLIAADAAKYFSGCDVVAECFDDPAAKAGLISAMRRFLPAVPVVAVSGIAGFGPASEITCRRIFDNYFLVGDGVSAAAPGQGLLAPRVTVAGGIQSSVIVRLLLGALTHSQGD
jgi:sulfur carrier protein ThiS adenylyltransferase